MGALEQVEGDFGLWAQVAVAFLANVWNLQALQLCLLGGVGRGGFACKEDPMGRSPLSPCGQCGLSRWDRAR